MNQHLIKNAGEVAVNAMESMPEFEKKSIQILRYANDLFERDHWSNLPLSIKNLFSNQFSRYLISDLICLLATHYLRPIVRHHPNCLCVGADENVFANLLRLSLEDHKNEAKILSSLLIKSEQIETLSKKAKVVAFLIDEDIKATMRESKRTQIIYDNQLH